MSAGSSWAGSGSNGFTQRPETVCRYGPGAGGPSRPGEAVTAVEPRRQARVVRGVEMLGEHGVERVAVVGGHAATVAQEGKGEDVRDPRLVAEQERAVREQTLEDVPRGGQPLAVARLLGAVGDPVRRPLPDEVEPLAEDVGAGPRGGVGRPQRRVRRKRLQG